MKNKFFSLDLLVPVLTVCVLFPATAGIWWRYNFEPSAPQPPEVSGTLQAGHLETNGEQLRAFTGYEFEALADRQGFLVAYPDSSARGWNVCRVASNNPARRQGIDDVDLLKALIRDARGR